jgi:AraC family transcriptional regulator
MISQEIINQSMDYILQHLQDSITVQDVSEHFHYSEYYFNREFRRLTGESVYEFIKRQRINQSAIEMKLQKKTSITDIGEKYGYSASNYSSAFKTLKNESPVEFRKSANQMSCRNPFNEETMDTFQSFDFYNQDITIKEIPDMTVMYQRYIGNYIDLKEAWNQFMRMHIEELQSGATMIERFYDDPDVVEVNQCICDLCILSSKTYESNRTTLIKGGKFAVYRFEGKIEDIYQTLQGMFRIWLPQSSYEMRQRDGFNIYRFVDLNQNVVVMDFCIPIQ